MADQAAERPEETYFRDQNWVAMNGGWIHSNNVLFYFAQSPFFDGTSSNSSVFMQAFARPDLSELWLGNRQRFEAQLRARPGIEYVVAHDPLQANAFVDGPSGPEQSRIWVIKKQRREKIPNAEDRVTPLAFYYIINEAIFQAPSTADILTNRLLTTTLSLSSLFSKAATLPVFAPSSGHTYFSPVQKQAKPASGNMLQQSKESTPMPGTQNSTERNGTLSGPNPPKSGVRDVQTLADAIRMTLQYGKEYIDDTPLAGEPGNFRLLKNKELTNLQPAQGVAAPRLTSPPRDKTPAVPPAIPAPPPRIDTDVPAVNSKKSAKGTDRSPTTPGGTITKAKRRKSKVAISLEP